MNKEIQFKIENASKNAYAIISKKSGNIVRYNEFGHLMIFDDKISAEAYLKSFIHEKYGFLVVFNFFNNKWLISPLTLKLTQPKNLKS